MADEHWILRFLTSPATPLYALLLVVGYWTYKVSYLGLPAIMERFNERRRVRAAEKDADWTRIRDERDHAIESRDAWMERAIGAETEKARLAGFDFGEGQVRQSQANVAAYERARAEIASLRAQLAAAKKDKPDG